MSINSFQSIPDSEVVLRLMLDDLTHQGNMTLIGNG